MAHKSCYVSSNNKHRTVAISQHSSSKGVTPQFTTASYSDAMRSSPGLLAGHYASCKWTEPPHPSSLPLPPSHWLITSNSTENANSSLLLEESPSFHRNVSDLFHEHSCFTTPYHDETRQLKLLLKMET